MLFSAKSSPIEAILFAATIAPPKYIGCLTITAPLHILRVSVLKARVNSSPILSPKLARGEPNFCAIAPNCVATCGFKTPC